MRFANGLTTNLVVFLAAMGIQAPAIATTFNVNNAVDLRSALLTAATNGEDDVILLAAGTYATGGTTFTFVTNETNNLTLQGASGTARDQVVLDGGGTSQVLNFSCVGSCGAITLQGLTVQNGNATGTGGGGVNAYASTGLTLSDVSFSGNQSAQFGGAIYGNTVTVINSTFSGNRATSGFYGGGAISAVGGSVTNSTFNNNTVTACSGFCFGEPSGGAISGAVTVTNSTFSNNTAPSGGAISGAVTVTNSTFSGNSTTNGRGGAISGSGAITNSTFSGNSATDGGAISGSGAITNSTFSGNSATSGNGGAIYGLAGLEIVNNTFSGNLAVGSGAAIYTQAGSASSIINSVFYGHSTPAVYATSAYNLYYNLIDTSTGIAGSSPLMAGNVVPGATSPFVDAVNGNFRLAAGSLAIDAGLDPNSTTFANLVSSSDVAAIRAELLTDLDGNPRPTPGTAVDIGAYESGTVAANPNTPVCTLTASPVSVTTGGTSTLTASCNPTATSYSWTGGTCPTTAASCTVTPSANTTYAVAGINASGKGNTAIATVTVIPSNLLTVTLTGSGTGTVTSSPAGINCGASCSASFPSGTSVNLTATPAAGSIIAGWTGACMNMTPGTATCTVSMNTAMNVTATFTQAVSPPTCTLTASPTSIAAGGTSTLTASCTPAATSYVWSADTGFGSTVAIGTVSPTVTTTYTVTGMNAGGTGNTSSAIVTVTLGTALLTVTQFGSGAGTVTSSPDGINCSATCSASFTSGATVTLTAIPASGSAFTGWSDACTGMGSCTVTVNAAKNVTAVFNPTGFVGSTTFNVNNSASLREALLTAATDGQDDVIVLAAGTYATGGITFTFATNETNTLTLEGADGTTRSQVVLDGGGTSQVLNFACAGTCGAITLQGLTVQNGNATGNGFGGGVSAFQSLILSDVSFSGNRAAMSGGAIRVDASASVTITNSSFSNNTASGYGGTLAGGTATVTNSSFTNNTAGQAGGAMAPSGASKVANSSFSNNTATSGSGGAITGITTVNTSFFSNNTAGGGVGGGAIYELGASPVTNSVFSNNTAVLGGGAISGFAISVNNTFYANTSTGLGAAISIQAGAVPIINSVFYGHTTPAIYATSAYNLYNNLIDTNTGIAGSTPVMVGNVAPGAISPFVDAANGNFQLAAGSLAIDAGLDPNSTTFANLVGSSNVASIRQALLTDLRGYRRPAPGTAVDIGAYEYGSTPYGGVMTVFGTRGTVTPTTSMYGSFVLANTSVMYIAVRGQSLKTLGYTQTPLDLPNVRVYDASGKDVLQNASGGVTVSGCASSATVNTYYATVRGGALDANDTCLSKTLDAGVYTFTINPNTSSSSGELLFEVTVNPMPPSGGVLTVFGTRGTATATTPMYGSFVLANTSVMYIAVRGQSLKTLGYTQTPLDLPNVRVYDASGKDVLANASGGVTVSGCPSSSTVANYYATVRGGALDPNDTCVSKTLDAGVYTFTINPNTSSSSGELLFEVTVNP